MSGKLSGKAKRAWWIKVAVVLVVLVTLSPAGRPGSALIASQEETCGTGRQAAAGALPAWKPTVPTPPPPDPHAPYGPPEAEPLGILIDTVSRRLTLLVNGFPFKSWPVAVGKPGTPSPVGEWQIVQKSRGWGRGFGTHWLGLNVPWGIYGIHGTDKPWSIGRRASGGCIRMRNQDVAELYEFVPRGTKVWIIGLPVITGRLLVPGHTGADVLAVQERLQELGLYHGPLDGRYGPGTAAAVKILQKQHDLPVTGQVNASVYQLLGLAP